MTTDELIAELGQFGQELSNIAPTLAQLGEDVAAQIRAKAPVDTGALKSSIRAYVNNNTLEIEMLYYGAFQNYGVNGTDSYTAREVQFGVSPRPTSEPFYAFKKRKFGLKAQNFFNMDTLTDFVVEQLLNETEI